MFILYIFISVCSISFFNFKNGLNWLMNFGFHKKWGLAHLVLS
jgi:hypothetical protein